MLPGRSFPVRINGHKLPERKNVFSKVFRWNITPEIDGEPTVVEVAGTFSDWKPVPMDRDAAGQGWHLKLDNIPNGRTHHYMFLANGVPVPDAHCDGLAIPQGPEEEQFAIETPRGRRVYMLFAQTK